MNCYNCGVELTEHDFCTNCGADVVHYKKVISVSNFYYNEWPWRKQTYGICQGQLSA